MAKVIDFYIPATFRKTPRWLPSEERGKVIEFYFQVLKPA